jgi:membrane-bound lytic murein transglycosylase A
MPEAIRRLQRLAGLLVCLTLAACVTPRYPVGPPPAATPPRGPYAPPAPSVPQPTETPEYRRLSDLPGWTEEDHAAGFRAFQAGCRVTPDQALYDLCRRARAMGEVGEDQARAFLEAHFRPRAIPSEGVLTGYFVPEYEARESPYPPFTAPVLPKPTDLPPGGAPYLDRAAIEAEEPGPVLAWMRPEDLFFMQIQGSGVIDFPDGRRMKASFAASNNQPFTPIAAPLRERGALTAANTSGPGIRAWLSDHRGPEADAVMRLNRRYVFFTLAPDDGLDPPGTAGLPLTPGRALAVDQSQHALGGLYWIDADAPVLHGAAPAYRRLAMALDTGGAIKGPARADLYLGRGDAAGVEAGHIRHTLRLYELVPTEGSGW